MNADLLQEAMDDVARHLTACAGCRRVLGSGFQALCSEGQRLIRAVPLPDPVSRKAGDR